MPDFYDLMQANLAAFLLMMTRISGIFIVSPVLGSMNVSVLFRAGMALAFTFLLFPVLDDGSVTAPDTVAMFAASVAAELFIGWLIGLAAYMVLSAISMAGKVMDMQVGFAMVNVMDPTSGQQIPLIGSFLYNLSIIVLLVTNGHHIIISALVESFRIVPVLGMSWDPVVTNIVASMATGIFLTGMKIAMPVIFANFLTNVGLGILARTMPQLNIFVVGMPMHVIIGLGVLAMMMPFYVLFLDVVFNDVYKNIYLLLHGLE